MARKVGRSQPEGEGRLIPRSGKLAAEEFYAYCGTLCTAAMRHFSLAPAVGLLESLLLPRLDKRQEKLVVRDAGRQLSSRHLDRLIAPSPEA